ncbi:hypothetical protein GALL_479990 [mine drainage metagenome]|uniref:Uncharacterized protein n=1 Tax=mine drainage metagenome TaxID=410659 RepID=A0A1J5PG50_9ZZZZ
MKPASPGAHGQPIFDAKGPRLIHQPGAFADKPVPDSMKRLQINLRRGAHFNKPHRRSGHGLSNGCGIYCVGFVRLHIGFHEPGRDDPRIMAHLNQPSCQPL